MKRLILVGLAAMSVTVPATGRCQPPVLLQTLDHYGPHGFARPWGISHDAAGNFYVLDYLWLRVFAFTSSGDTLRSWPVPFRSMYMAVGGDGLAYLTAPYPDGTCLTPVLVYTLDGALVSIWDGSGSGPGQFIHPEGVAVDEAGRVYVSEQGNARVQVLTADGQPVTQWGSRGTAPGQFSDPEGLALGRDGLVYVTDADNETVQVFTRRGDLVRWWGGEFGGDPGQFWGLRGITLDASGNVYIADTGNDRIQVFTATGAYLTEWGTRGFGPGQFDHPMSVAIRSDGRIFVADTWNGRVQVFGPVPTAAATTSWWHVKTLYRR